ncbi:MAG: hypothetical protein J1G01_00590 [Clostridiales bacterium]|nr:hypothetical protein [Clostridiales bacterium]
MFKRIVFGILSFVLTACLLLGCSFFTHDTERDLQQEVARVKSYTITNTVSTDDDDVNKTVEYVTATKKIYKRDLVEYVNNNASNLSSSFGADYKGLYNYAVTMLINVELVTNEVDALIDCGKIEWDVAEQNEIRKNIYSIIDNTLTSIKNDILSSRGQEEITTGDDNVSTDTTYPVKPDEDDEEFDGADDVNKTPEEVWKPSYSKYPGIHGENGDINSLEREAVRRFLALIKQRVKGDFRLDRAERKWLKTKINNEIKAIDKLIDTNGIEAVYPVIGDYSYPMKESKSEFGYIMYYVSGESLERSQKITALQSYLSDSVKVSTDEVVDRYTSTLNEQRELYSSDISAYDSAMSSNASSVLYHPVSNYFYVKHILLPFSDDQKTALSDYKALPEVSSLQEDDQEAMINEFREQLAESITCYPHVNGEDDLTRPMSVDDVMSHVRSVMLPLEANITRADVAFDDLIYLYNTDPGAFGNNQGYIVKYALDDGERETYMQEFADASREMYDTLRPGQVYYKKVITDYGVHIMYFASKVNSGAVALNDYTTPGRLETYYDILEAPIRSDRESAAYTNWENNVFSYNYNKYSVIYEDTFSDLWKD